VKLNQQYLDVLAELLKQRKAIKQLTRRMNAMDAQVQKVIDDAVAAHDAVNAKLQTLKDQIVVLQEQIAGGIQITAADLQQLDDIIGDTAADAVNA
jgi:cytochrome c553